jgi:ribose transport system permease protein
MGQTKKASPQSRTGLPATISRLAAHYSFILVFIVIFLVYIVISNGLTWSGMMNIFRHSAVIGVISIGMGLVCLTGEIDLSVGSMLAMVAGFSVIIFNITDSIFVTLLFAMALGAFCGFINGLLIGGVRIPAFIVTLSTMLIYRSLAQYFCQHIPSELCGGGSSVYNVLSTKKSYKALYSFGNKALGTIPNVGIVLMLITILFVYICTSTKFGKKIYAIGSNQKAALMVGIGVGRMKVLIFAITGLLTGVGAFLWIAMNASADPATTGSSYEMYAIAAVVLGGISMSGGKGKCLGILFGVMSYTVIDKIIVALKMDSLINNTIKGIMLLVVIMLQIVGPEIKEWFSLHLNRKAETDL